MKTVQATVVSNQELMAGVRLMEFEAPEIASIAEPGQFVMIRCAESFVLPRPFSIHGASRETGRFSLLFALRGRGTRWLTQRRSEEIIQITGPLGNTFLLPEEPSNLLMVAGGIGIAPLTFLISEALNTHVMTLLIGATTAAKLYPKQMLPGGVGIVTITDDGSTGKRGLVSDAISDYLSWADKVYVCGPLPMYRAIAERLSERRVIPPVEVSLEVRMGCGLGICYGCTVKTRHGVKQVCRDGPVFPMDEVIWDSVAC
ncbi:MAG: dihydroorotate dehydrogenase electron transfer subunit [Chloroflexota bacterium]